MSQASQQTPTPVPDQIEQLMLNARTALKERRVLAPAGDNAIESYFAVLNLESNHVGARQALLELIPPASDAVESAIAAGDLDEAQRRFDLFKQMGVSELRLNPIRTRLTAARAESARVAAATAAAADAAAARAATVAAAPPVVAPAAAPTPPVVTTPEPAPPTPTPAPSSAPTVAARQPAPPPPVAAADRQPVAVAATQPTPVADIIEPRQIVNAVPSYPSIAKQRRLEGWVELEVAIGSDGEVGEVSVVRSEPAKVFDREAIRAAQRWRFEPRRENGVAVPTRVRKTLNFKLTTG